MQALMRVLQRVFEGDGPDSAQSVQPPPGTVVSTRLLITNDQIGVCILLIYFRARVLGPAHNPVNHLITPIRFLASEQAASSAKAAKS